MNARMEPVRQGTPVFIDVCKLVGVRIVVLVSVLLGGNFSAA